ncbi:MAG: HRDC domain-containing protein [Clostridium sp.]
MALKDLFKTKKIKEPIFYKGFKEDDKQIEELERLLKGVSDGNIRRRIEAEIYAMKKGQEGEKAVCYEIKNSFIPMLVLHNIRIVVDDKVAQMDYVLITHKFVMVVETKRLYSDISINKYGDFELVGRNGKGQFYRKGIYSPVVQNDRHVRILESLLEKNKLLKKTKVCSEIFLSNEKANIDRRYAQKKIGDQVSKLDKFTERVNERIENATESLSEDKMYKIADLLIREYKEAEYDYEKKFMVENIGEAEEVIEEIAGTIEKDLNKNKEIQVPEDKEKNEEIREKLIEYRKIQAREEKIQAYCVYKNEAIENIIENKPKTLEELRKIKGVGDKTVEKYGVDILEIIKRRK